jgi:serine/threonine-protein kinase
MTQARLLGGRYQVGELLGYGGMAEVHRGRDLRLGRDVAIKMLRTDLARDDTFQLRFRREAQNAAALNHPAIVAVYDTGEERGSSGETLPYIVMEFVNGRTLKEVLAVEGRLMPRRALEITAEICSALEFSHRHQIIHRDIKPGNVMMTQTGQIKVMDFGIARALSGGGSTMTQTSAVIGTAQYLSPEQARGESVDARSDVYATGCVLYELLCGQPPFVGDSPVSVAYQHVREDAKPPSILNRDVPPPVDAVVLKALAKNPLNRYQSAGEMRADVLRAAAGRPVYAEPVMPETDHGATRSIRTTPGGRPTPARVGVGGQGRRTRVGRSPGWPRWVCWRSSHLSRGLSSPNSPTGRPCPVSPTRPISRLTS